MSETLKDHLAPWVQLELWDQKDLLELQERKVQRVHKVLQDQMANLVQMELQVRQGQLDLLERQGFRAPTA